MSVLKPDKSVDSLRRPIMGKKGSYNQIPPEDMAIVLIQAGLCGENPDPLNTLAKIQIGKELGLEPVQSVSNIEITGSKICIQSKALESLILKAGHKLQIENPDKDSFHLECFREDSLVGVVKCQVSQLGFRSLNQYPDSDFRANEILFGRALGIAARKHYFDVFTFDVYTPEDLLVEKAIEEELAAIQSSKDSDGLPLNLDQTLTVLAET